MKAISAPFKKGVNFTNWMEFKSPEEINENYFTKQDFENVLKLGCDVVRIPMHFEKFCSEDNGFLIPDIIWSILDRLESWAEELHLYLIFDFHNATAIGTSTSADVEKILTAVWKQIGIHFANKSSYLVYELMNEPHGIDVEIWNGIIKRVFDSLRKYDQKHFVIVGGADWNSFSAMKTLPDFNDDKVIYNFHFYDPHTFTHQGASWCNMERVIGIPFPYDQKKMPSIPADATDYEREKFENYPAQGTVEKMMEFFDQYVEFSVQRNAPVYCGEFGCFAIFADPIERVNWYKMVADALEERNIARTSWDYYGPFGIFDFKKIMDIPPQERRNFSWKFPQDLNVEIVKALGLIVPVM